MKIYLRNTFLCQKSSEISHLVRLNQKIISQAAKLRRSGVFIVNFDHISHLALVFLLLTLNMQLPAGMGLFK